MATCGWSALSSSASPHVPKARTWALSTCGAADETVTTTTTLLTKEWTGTLGANRPPSLDHIPCDMLRADGQYRMLQLLQYHLPMYPP